MLKEIAIFSKGSGLTKDSLSNTGNKCILYGELYTKYLGYISEITSKTNDKLDKPKLSNTGDIIMPLSGETPIDMSNSAVIPEDNVILGSDLLVISPMKNFDSLFLSYYISNCKKIEIAKKSNGISIIHSHKEDIERLIINYPSYEEQCCISNFIKLLVTKTNILLKKINTLKKYKEGLQKELLKNVAINSKSSLKNIVTFEPKSKIQAGDSIDDGLYSLYKSGTENGKLNTYSHDGVYIIANDGGTAQFKLTNGKFSYTDHCICFKGENDEETIVLCNYLQSLEKKINYIGFIGTGLKNIDRQYLGIIKYPIINDKKTIAKSFILIDRAIANLENKYNSLITIKKFMLNNLFI